jgi:hypothetical protein
MIIPKVNFIMTDTAFLKPTYAFKQETSLPLGGSTTPDSNYMLYLYYLRTLDMNIQTDRLIVLETM